MSAIHYLDPNPSGHPAVLLLHDLGADGTSWALQLPVLAAAGFRPLAPDAPGFGRSPYDGRGWSIRRVAAQLAALLDELGTGPAHVVGLSMGGTIAQQFALDFPQQTRSLVLASTFSVLRPESVGGWIYFLQRFILVNTLGLPAQAKVVAERVFPDPDNRALRDMLVDIVSHADPRAYRKAMFCLGAFDSRLALARLHVPTLVITGSADTTVSPDRQERLAHGISGARRVVIPGAGHAVSIDCPERFNQELLGFFKSASGVAR